MKKIAVIFGGESVEHDISIITGVLTLNAIDKNLFEPIPVYISKEGRYYTGNNLTDPDEYKSLNLLSLTPVTFIDGDNGLYEFKLNKKNKGKLKRLYSISCAINCTHGERGEDGCVSAKMKTCKIPLASPAMMASSVCMDKWFTKVALKGLKVKSLKGDCVKDINEYIEKKGKGLRYPLIVKPNSSGSSIGVARVENLEQLRSAFFVAKKYGEYVIIEPYIKDFVEINCAAYRNFFDKVIVSELEKPSKAKEFLSFSDKYENGDREFPACVSPEIREQVQSITRWVYENIKAEGIIRIDFMIASGEVIVNEINTVPGSLAYYLFTNNVKEFSKFLTDMLGGVMKRSAKLDTEIHTFNSGLLDGFRGKGAKKVEKKD